MTRWMRLSAVLLACVGLSAGPTAAASTPTDYDPYLGKLDPETQRWFSAIFEIYAKAFVTSDGRVFDPQNGGITHSESQGYGMMLALLGGDAETFDRIWSFARRHLQRPDKLFAWKYVPGRGITDRNNATDGEILIATALSLAAVRWNRTDYAAAAVPIADAVGAKLILRHGPYTVLLRGEWARPDGVQQRVTINLSYFIPVAIRMMEALAPNHPWEDVYRDSFRILDDLIHPPSDWTSIDENGEPVPAAGFPRVFSYDAVRIPLYLAQGGYTHPNVTRYLREAWGDPDDTPHLHPFDVMTFEPQGRFWQSAYDFIYELMHCAETGEPVTAESMGMSMENYFASSLHIMAIAGMYANYPHCYPRATGDRSAPRT